MKYHAIFTLLLALSLYSYGQGNTQSSPDYSPKGSLSLRTNLIHWVMLTPNLGVEYKAAGRIGLIAEGGWAHWNLNSPNKYCRMWNIAPQARYYMGEDRRGYIGAQYTMGEYNLLGGQGRYKGAGLTLGRQFYAGKNLMVDLGLSLGYLYLCDKEKYQRTNGHDYLTGGKKYHGDWGAKGRFFAFVWEIK